MERLSVNLTFMAPCIANIARYISIYLARCNFTQLIISGNCSTCFGCYFHPSSGAHTVVSTASCICHTVTATCRYRGGVGTAVPPIIWSAYNCMYSVWYLSHRYCYLPLSWRSWDCSPTSSTIAAGSSNGVINTRCCRYSCLRS
jgi:hypothetical protein